MSHNTFAFWICTLLSGIVIGIATQRIPDSRKEIVVESPSYADYATIYKSPLRR